jgi:pyruvate formate-lyase activating enzyme-like uncharacterized protein
MGLLMITEINRDNLATIRNPRFATYAAMYLDIGDAFLAKVVGTGIQVDSEDRRPGVAQSVERLKQRGVTFRNDDRSAFLNWISPACVACQRGIGSATFFISLKCNRRCFFCFNPNQEDFAYYSTHQRDCQTELDQIQASGERVDFLGLTGGEPLLHKAEAVGFFAHAREKFPEAHNRLYTSGDLADEGTLRDLGAAGLQEIRFSARLQDGEDGLWSLLATMAAAKKYVPAVMVEMPVLPDGLAPMRKLLDALETLGIQGINLLELCYPLRNAAAFRSRGYMVKNPPYRVLYDYWYGGGLPVAGSEETCLALLEYALDRQMRLGIHYCSGDNKHTGQIYQQNTAGPISAMHYLSGRDYFLKSAKVFGDDAPRVLKVLRKTGERHYHMDDKRGFLEFPLRRIADLTDMDRNRGVEVGISYSVREIRDGEPVLRELKVDLAHPSQFDLSADA